MAMLDLRVTDSTNIAINDINGFPGINDIWVDTIFMLLSKIDL